MTKEGYVMPVPLAAASNDAWGPATFEITVVIIIYGLKNSADAALRNMHLPE